MSDGERKQPGYHPAAQSVLAAYRELVRIVHQPQGFVLEDLQGAVEYLLDAVKSADRTELRFIVPPKEFYTD